MKELYSSRAFTLIELMVVISIIALFSSIGMFAYADARVKANDAKKETEVGQVEKAILLQRDAIGFVPANHTGSNSVAVEGTDAYNQSMQELINNGYISSIPKSSDGTYIYYANSTSQSAVFGAKLKSSTQVSSVKSSCPSIIQTTYQSCWKTENVPSGTQNLVTFSDSAFCSKYGNAQCYNGADGSFSYLCRGSPFLSGCIYSIQGPYTISCAAPTGNASICSGGVNDFCACIE
ncbi:MAG: prepilin-type N-terminal cleavage/methylation domain-containing protein [Candidatus Paceibacterota bacterium]|jgi:prepilin-type N-terminal cleavage/methylation domain-containing protein